MMPRQAQAKPQMPTAAELAGIFNEMLGWVRYLHGKFRVADDALVDEPDRERMVSYLQARAWRGTDAGACASAKIPVTDLLRWREESPEFVDLEKQADEACTDILEETALLQGYLGDKDMVKLTLKARRSAKYSDRQEVTGQGGGPVEFVVKMGDVPRPQKRLGADES